MSIRRPPRGFALMSKDRRVALASKGGKVAHLKGTAHEWTPEEARQAGSKGGKARVKNLADRDNRRALESETSAPLVTR